MSVFALVFVALVFVVLIMLIVIVGVFIIAIIVCALIVNVGVFVIVVCEAAGRSSDRMGRGLAYLAVVVSSVPVAYSLGLLVYHFLIVPGSFAQ